MQWPSLICLLCLSLVQAKLYLIETSGKVNKSTPATPAAKSAPTGQAFFLTINASLILKVRDFMVF